MMKHFILTPLFLLLVGLNGMHLQTAQAQEKKHKGSYSGEHRSVIRYSQAEAASSNQYKLQVGLSTINNAPTIYEATSLIGGGSLTALLELSQHNAIQAFFTIPSTNPFNFDLLGLYKRTVLDDGSYGIHVGGGFGLGLTNSIGNKSSLVLNFVGVAGFHFEVPGAPHLKIHLDAGPSITIINATPTQTSFQVGALSPTLGLSVLYSI